MSKKIILLFSLFLLCLPSACTGKNLTPAQMTQILREPDSPNSSSRRISIIRNNGGRVSWSPQGDLILIDQKGSDGYYDLYLIQPDGSNEQCLTCDTSDVLSKGHKGTAEWHPSGNYIVFQSQKKADTGNWGRDIAAQPGFGRYMDIWLMEVKTRKLFQLTHTANTDNSGVLHPHFSHDDGQLTWSEMYEAPNAFIKARQAGSWQVKLADFSFKDGAPELSNIRTFEPGGPGLYENHGLSPDGRKLLFTGTFERTRKSEIFTASIYSLDINDNNLQKLASRKYNEHAHYTPDGRKIVWMTSADNKNKGTDYWSMNLDGTNKRQLTYFNSKENPGYRRQLIIAADASFNPEGNKLVAYLQLNLLTQEGPIVIIEFDEDWDREQEENGATPDPDTATGGPVREPPEEIATGGVTTEVINQGSGGSGGLKSIYLGYYAEDPLDNPEDPVGGFISAILPESGVFNADFLFSYLGCNGGIDSGQASGKRTQESLSGSWSGTADGARVTGKMTASHSGNSFSGTYSVDGGKKRIGPFDSGCSYYIAGHGRFHLSAIGNNVATEGGNTSHIQFTCTDIRGSTGYAWAVAESDCLSTTGSISSCSNWNGFSYFKKMTLKQGTTIKQLRSDTEYVVGCIGFSAAGNPLGIATGTFKLEE